MTDASWLGGFDQAFCLRFIQALMHFLWQGAVAGALVWLLARSQSSCRTRYAVNVAGLLLMAACIPVTFLLLPNSVKEVGESETSQPYRRQVGDEVRVDSSTAAVSTKIAASSEPTNESNLPSETQLEFTNSDPIEIARSDNRQLLGSAAAIGTVIYLFGVAVMLLRIGVGLFSAHRLQRLATPVMDHELWEVLRSQARRIGVKVVPAIAYCRSIAVPVVVGIIKPTILLPSSLASGFAPDQIEAILTHELAHIRRLDLVVNLFQRIVESLLFFHPAVWFVSRQVSNEREHCCDDFVLASGCQRMQYADALIRMAELCGGSRGSLAASQLASMAATGRNNSQLRQRVMRVLGDDQRPRLRLTRFGIVMVAVIVCALAIAPAVIRTLAFAQEASPRPQESALADKGKERTGSQAEDAASAGRSEAIISLAFSPDGNQLVGGTSHKTVQVWDAAKGSRLKTLEGHAASVEGVRFSPDGQKLYCASKDINIWDVATWRRLKTVKFDHEEEHRFATWSPDASLVAVFGQQAHLKLFHTENGKLLRSIRLPGEGMTADFSPDAKEIATGSHATDQDAPAIHIWDVETGELRRSLKCYSHVTALAYSPDGRTLAYSGYDKGWRSGFGGLVMEDLESGKRREFGGFSGSIREIAFSPNGLYVATGGYGPEILKPGSRSHVIHSETKVFALSSGRIVYSNVGEPRRVRAVRFSPNSTLVASSDEAIVAVRSLAKRFGGWMRFADSPFRMPNRRRNAIELLTRREPSIKEGTSAKQSATEKAPRQDDRVEAKRGNSSKSARSIPKQGRLATAEELRGVSFGPAAANGLRVAWVFDPAKREYAVGEDLKTRVMIHNSGTKAVQFIGTDFQDGEWSIRSAEGKPIETKDLPYSNVWLHLRLDPFQRYRLEPGHVVELHGKGVGIGEGRHDAAKSQTEIWRIIHARPGDTVRIRVETELTPTGFKRIDSERIRMGVDRFYDREQLPEERARDWSGILRSGEVQFKVVAAKEAPEAKAKPPTAERTLAAEKSHELRPFAPDGGRFRFSTAGGRNPVNVAYQRGDGAAVAKGRLLCFDQPHCRCQVRYVDLPASAKDLSLLEVLKKYGFSAWAEKGNYKREKVVKAGEHVGEEYTVVGLPVGPFKYSHVRVQVFVANKQAFFVSASCPEKRKTEAEPEIRAFLNSFRILDQKGQKNIDQDANASDASSNTQFLIDALKAANKVKEGKGAEREDSKERKPKLLDVSIRILGGKAKKPLRKMTVRAHRERGQDSVASGLTDKNGNVVLKLSAGYYYLDLQPQKEVPYLALPLGYRRNPYIYTPMIRVGEKKDAREFTFNLADACKLTLRAVDADTGEGIPGVTLVMENIVGEYYALPINGDNLGARSVSDLKDVSLKTDKSGEFHRLMGPREGWTYYVWGKPPVGYEEVTPGEEVELDTSLGKERAEYTFKFRRKSAK